MKRIILILAVFLALFLLLALMIVKNENSQTNININPSSSTNINTNQTPAGKVENTQTKTTKVSDLYDAKLNLVNDHYELTIFTNLADKPFEFTYNAREYLLDDTPALFKDAKFTTNGDQKTCSIQLESNKLYVFSFIKKAKTELEIGKNLIIK